MSNVTNVETIKITRDKLFTGINTTDKISAFGTLPML
jgi:hypothetical protein